MTDLKLNNSMPNYVWDIPAEPPVDMSINVPDDWMEKLLIAKEKLMKQSLQYQEKALRDYQSYKMALDLEGAKHAKNNYLRLKNVKESDIQASLTAFSEGKTTSYSGTIILMMQTAKLEEQPNISIRTLFRLFSIYQTWWDNINTNPIFIKLSQQQLTDFRQIVTLAKAESIDTQRIQRISEGVLMSSSFFAYHSHLQLWPYFAEHKEIIDDGLRLHEEKQENNPYFNLTYFTIINQFPTIPDEWKKQIYTFAIGNKESKSLQTAAQQCAETIGKKALSAGKSGVDITLIAAQLTSKTKELRIESANWLTRLNATETMPAISQAIQNEKDIPIRAALIANFEKLGGNIKPFLSIEVLTREALAGLKKEPPKTMTWFTKEAIPECYFQDGQKVDADIIYWWLALAVALRTPQGNSLFDNYLKLLNQSSQRALATHILTSFIAYDTLCPSDAEAHKYAEMNKQSTFSDYPNLNESYHNKTLEDAYNQCFSEHKSRYLGSAIKEKGMLCFIKGGDSAELLATIQLFMKNHFLRRTQIESLLMPLADLDDPAIIQFLLSTSRRYRAKSIQKLAKTLVTQIAERNHWTADELADRTIQTAGLSHVDRPTEFEYGSRTLSISLSDDLKLNLFNDSGKLIKALPQPRQQDVKERISEAKKWFSNCKKELKQIATQQAERLQEAMISNRTWSDQDWLEYLHQHPVMFRLLQRTLWQVQANENDPWVTFRPTEDGDFIDVNDDEVTIKKDSQIRVLSANHLNLDELKQWKAHLKDYKIKPLFEQLRFVDIQLNDDQTALEHYHGFLTDSLTLRGLLTKKSYKAGAVMDAGFFDYYSKNVDSLSVQVRFYFSEHCIDEGNTTITIYNIMLINLDNIHVYNPPAIPLADISPNLLNAIAIEYEEIAAKCMPNAN